jgi:hypothetical protein
MTSVPIRLKSGFTSIGSGDFGIWNINQCTTLPTLATSISCTSGSGSFADYSGFPVVYEKPIMIAYQEFISALAKHYSPLGNGYGPTLAPYIAYVRVGMSAGGESYPYCSVGSNIPQATRPTGTFVPAGYVAYNPADGDLYVAIGAGNTSSGAMPACGSAGCLTPPDNTVPGWYNSGAYANTTTNNAVWPGPQGQFGSTGESQGYTDNGYLSAWPNSGDGVGYIASMTSFLSSLGAGFPFTISAHTGPTSDSNNSYPDSAAIIASSNHVGFGMQSVNVGDPVEFAAGTYPTTRENWAHNFQAYAAPVHHLQTNDPGTTNLWTGYAISSITVGTVYPYTATVTCLQDCSWLYAQEIYISGNSNPSLNGTWAVSCTTQALCGMDQLTFSTSLALSGFSGNNGTVWSPDYWPIVVPFATLRGASSIELWECSLDYAFDTDTTASGCATGITPPSGGDIGFQNPLTDSQNGQPAATHVLTGVQSTGGTFLQ